MTSAMKDEYNELLYTKMVSNARQLLKIKQCLHTTYSDSILFAHNIEET